MSTTEQKSRRSVVLKEIPPDEERSLREKFGKAMAEKSITWVRTEEGPLTIQEYGLLLEALIDGDSQNETGVRIE